MPLQLPLPRTLRPSRKATCSASVHGVPFLPSFCVPSLEPLRWWVGVVGGPGGGAARPAAAAESPTLPRPWPNRSGPS